MEEITTLDSFEVGDFYFIIGSSLYWIGEILKIDIESAKSKFFSVNEITCRKDIEDSQNKKTQHKKLLDIEHIEEAMVGGVLGVVLKLQKNLGVGEKKIHYFRNNHGYYFYKLNKQEKSRINKFFILLGLLEKS